MTAYKPTVSQNLVWLDQAISKNYSKFNIGGYAELEGILHYDHFRQAVKAVLKSQEVYSSVFSEVNGELQCSVKDASDNYLMPLMDFSGEKDPQIAAGKW